MGHGILDLWHMFEYEPRESWYDLVKPYVTKETKFNAILGEDFYCGFILENIKADYKCKFNINDIVYADDGKQWLVYAWPLLDVRNKAAFDAVPIDNIINQGGYIDIIRLDPNVQYASGARLLLNNEVHKLDHRCVTDEYLSLVPENEISEDMIKLREYRMNYPDHKIIIVND